MMKKWLSLFCAVVLVLGLMVVPTQAAESPVTMKAQGWYETICAEIAGVTDSDVKAVSYIDADGVETALTGEDLTYLVRDMTEGGVRIDIPGVKAGTYGLSVTAKGETYTAWNIAVKAYDRSGFAHKVHTRDAGGNITGIKDYTEGVGAYNDDGTLKENATVLYITEDTKNTVSLTQGFTVTGIGHILNSRGWDKSHSGDQRKLLMKMADANRPLVVRIIGTVTAPEGVTDKASDGNGGSKKDNGGMCIMQCTSNITIEGIGPDATVSGWGFSFDAGGSGNSRSTGSKIRGKNFEVRNITFRNVPEDCVGIIGSQAMKDGVTSINDSAEHNWVHNCEFYVPKIPNPAESDKAEGDGAVDFRQGEYMTMSYNHFYGYHKTSLIGGADDNLQFHVTWHHNWWTGVESRSPLGRQADIHIYNNLYDGQTSYCMSLRGNSYVFSEYNTFLKCSNPVKLEKSDGSTLPVGACKSYNDVFTDCKGTNQATKVTDKTKPVSSTCLYKNFDTDAKLSYIPTGDYLLQTSAAEAEKTVRAEAGTMKAGVTAAALDPEVKVEEKGTLGQLEWVYTDQGEVMLLGGIPAGAMIFVAGYDGSDRCAKVGGLADGKATLGAGVGQGKLFWLDENLVPLYQDVGWRGAKQ